MTFITPLFLFAAGAALLPVLFHFVRRMKARPVPFGSLMLLRATPKELVKRRRLRDLLLLACRVGLLILLAFAFARPYVPAERLPFIPERADRSTVILLDRSFSMQLPGVFEQARAEVIREIDTAGDADEIALVGFSDRAEQLTPLSRDAAVHRSVAGGIMPSYRPTEFHGALRLAADILKDASYEQHRVVLISDLQRIGFTPALENFTLPEGTAFVPIKITSNGKPGNSYVEDFRLTMRRTGNTLAVRYDARIRSEGEAERKEKVVTLTVGRTAADHATLLGEQSIPVTFRQTLQRTGFFQGSISISPDVLPIDDEYHFTYLALDPPSVLAVDRAPGRRDAFFLRHAFSASEASPFSFDDARDLRISILRPHDVVIVANLAQVTESETEALRTFVEDGGGLILSFGEMTVATSWSRTLAALGIGITDGIATARVRQGADAIIGQIDERHPIFEPLIAEGQGAILRPTFRRYLVIAPDSGASILGSYDSSDPFLVERRLGRGRILAYSSGFSTSWTDFPFDELYVPLLYRMAEYAYGASEAHYGFTVGHGVPIAGRPNEEWDIRAPGGNISKVTLDGSGTGFFRDTNEPGQYAATSGRNEFRFSVNVDPSESNLASRDEEEAYATVTIAPSKLSESSAETSVDVEREEMQQKLWRVFLILAVGLFLVETLVAHRVASR